MSRPGHCYGACRTSHWHLPTWIRRAMVMLTSIKSTAVYSFFRPYPIARELTSIEGWIDNIRKWMQSMKLKMNDFKAEYMPDRHRTRAGHMTKHNYITTGVFSQRSLVDRWSRGVQYVLILHGVQFVVILTRCAIWRQIKSYIMVH